MIVRDRLIDELWGDEPPATAAKTLQVHISRLRKALASDPAVQERIAREEFGMVRGDREILYRFHDPAVPGRRP